MRALRIAMAMCVAAALLSLTLATVAAHDDGDHRGGHQDTIWLAISGGKFETPPRDTPARGFALFSMDGGSGYYLIVVSKSSNVFAAHIHWGPPGCAAPVGVTWFMGSPASGPLGGVLVRSRF